MVILLTWRAEKTDTEEVVISAATWVCGVETRALANTAGVPSMLRVATSFTV